MGFLRRGFFKSSSYSLFQANRGDSSVVEPAGGVKSFSPLDWSLFCSTVEFGTKGQEDKIVAFLSALDEEHMLEDKIEGCEL